MRTIDALTDEALDQLDDLVHALQAHPQQFAPGACELITRFHKNFKHEPLVYVSLPERLVIHQLHTAYIERVALQEPLKMAAL